MAAQGVAGGDNSVGIGRSEGPTRVAIRDRALVRIWRPPGRPALTHRRFGEGRGPAGGKGRRPPGRLALVHRRFGEISRTRRAGVGLAPKEALPAAASCRAKVWCSRSRPFKICCLNPRRVLRGPP